MPPETDRELLTAALEHLYELLGKGSSRNAELLKLVRRLEVRLDVAYERRWNARGFLNGEAPGSPSEHKEQT